MERSDETTTPLDDASVPRPAPARPTRLLSHMLACAIICLVAIYVDHRMRYARGETERVMQIKIALSAYGAICAIVCLKRPSRRDALTPSDRIAIVVCLVLFVFTALHTLLPVLN